jgi:2-polyprenyl-3-methyl-5-hydroxy-6-metoxy-1,4-benzoquinol methylase
MDVRAALVSTDSGSANSLQKQIRCDELALRGQREQMKAAYSCVVDGTPKFEWQAVTLCSSLMHNAAIAAEDIKVHVLPSVSTEFRDFVLDHGMTLVPIKPFSGNHGYCNKIQQMFSSAFIGYRRAILCDCDLYFVRGPDIDRIATPAAGRVVDRPNPPLALLKTLYEKQGIVPSPQIGVGFPDCSGEQTVASNWNGGLYVFDVVYMWGWGRFWAECATKLLVDLPLLGGYENHVDQISWALTVDRLSIAYEHLTSEHNYPIHFDEVDYYRRAPTNIASFHYHHKMDSQGAIQLSGAQEVDRQLDEANRRNSKTLTARIISDEALYSLFERWQTHCSASQLETTAAPLVEFQNARYSRHNARRLEHLASLNLEIRNKSVLELGAGIGDHSLFFLDRDCHVVSIEPREQNVACILHRQSAEANAFPRNRHKIIRCSAEESLSVLGDARFQIVYNYGLLYHLSDPEHFLRQSALLCEGLYLLETAVSNLIQTDTMYTEDSANLTNSVGGICRLLSRENIFGILRECLPFVYMPTTQPAHEQFLCDWSIAPKAPLNRHRAVFIGSMTTLRNPMLSNEVVEQHVK